MSDKRSSLQIYLGAKCVTAVEGKKVRFFFLFGRPKINADICAKFDIKEKLQNFGSQYSQIGDFLISQFYETQF